MRVYYYYLLILLFLNIGCTPKPLKLIRRASVQRNTFKQIIPYTPIKRIMVVKMKLQNGQTYRFIWDTGASVTVINRKVATVLGLKPITSMKVIDSRKKSKRLGMVKLSKVELGNVKFKNIAALVIDFPQESVFSCYAEGGIIGTNIIARCNWTIDYEKQELTLTNTPFDLQKNPQAIAFKTGFSGRMFFNAQLLGKPIKNILFDSGSTGVLDLKTSFGIKSGILKKYPSNKLIDGTTQGIYGTRIDTSYLLTLDSLKVGKLIKSQANVEISRFTSTKIGNKVLQHFKIHIDYTHKRMLWLPSNTTSAQTQTFGVLFKRDKNGKISIGSLYQPSQAAAEGIKVNEEIVKINNKPVKVFFKDKCDFYQWMFNLNKVKRISLTFKNGRKITLEKKPLAQKFWWPKN
mgnify:CR=1 FL=1